MKNHPSIITATKPQNRIISLDILRGWALFGIAIVNILGFNASFFDFGGFYGTLPDQQQLEFYELLIGLSADKFIFLFSFLFGYGIWMQMSRFLESTLSFSSFFTRRMLLLALFGIAHVLFLWAGDILIPYAIAGMVVLALRKLPDHLLLIFGIFMYFFVVLWLVISIWFPLPDGLSSGCPTCLGQALDVYANGNYWQIFQLRLIEYSAFLPVNLIYYLPKVMGITIFGFLASKHKLHAKIIEHRWKWSIFTLILAILAIIVYSKYEAVVFVLFTQENVFTTAGFMLGYEIMNLFVAFSYLLIVLVLCTFKWTQLLLSPLSYLGRMSLTNYLLQSIFFGFLFYGWGLGFFGWQKPTQIELFALFIILVEIIVSYFWLKEFSQGPLEMFWRKWSYRK
jgi:uncharacterized protein